jgi:hypothetical protein
MHVSTDRKNISTTIDHLCSILSEDSYKNGLDTDSVQLMLEDLKQLISGKTDIIIHCPEPVAYRTYRTILPEGYNARRQRTKSIISDSSTTSFAQSVLSKVSTTKSFGRYKRYVGFIEEDADDSLISVGANTVKVNNGVVHPTPSLEEIAANVKHIN